MKVEIWPHTKLVLKVYLDGRVLAGRLCQARLFVLVALVCVFSSNETRHHDLSRDDYLYLAHQLLKLEITLQMFLDSHHHLVRLFMKLIRQDDGVIDRLCGLPCDVFTAYRSVCRRL